MKHISQILAERKTIFADENCEDCAGTGFIPTPPEGMLISCHCVTIRSKLKEEEKEHDE